MSNVALVGGSFNPIHIGHIELAQYVLDNVDLIDQVWLCPCNNSLYGKELESGQHRINMCNLAIESENIKVCDWEIRNNMSGKTFDLIKDFLNEYKNHNFFFTIGLDNAYKAHNWFRWEDLKNLIPFIVVPRQGITKQNNVDWFLKYPHVYCKKEFKITEISSSEIRNWLKNPDENYYKLQLYLNHEVLNYINTNDLYI